jgi:hypothetical protein
MTTRWLAVVALVGCGAKPAEPLAVPKPIRRNELPLSRSPHVGAIHSVAGSNGAETAPHVLGPGEIALPRPALETALEPRDINELGRWPLTIAEHPALEPHFDVAAALADPGISWTDLCARGAQHRHLASHQELADYLDAWCSVTTSNYSDAIQKLGHVRTAPNAQLVRALKLDVAALAAAHGPAHDLESFLRGGGFLDVAQVDLVAAAYFEIGKLEDAAEANELAEGMDVMPAESVRCMRMLRRIADTANDAREDAIRTLKLIAYPPSNDIRVPHCRANYEEVLCWKDRDCNGYWGGLVPAVPPAELQTLGDVYEEWSRLYDAWAWYRAATKLMSAGPLRDRYALLIPALGAALRTTGCPSNLFREIDELATRAIAGLAPTRPIELVTPTRAELEAEVERKAELANLTRSEIAAFRTKLHSMVATAKRLERVDRDECLMVQASLPPVQP